MSICAARVDERMIHGQVAMVWTNVVGANRILVANDDVVKDDLKIEGLKLAKPAGIKLSICSIQRAIENLKNNKYGEDNVFLITRNIPDMANIINGGVDLKEFNVGNISSKDGSQQIKKSVNVTPKDIEIIKDLINKGIKITAQMVPNEPDSSIMAYIEK
ncbi:PTS system mannose/fructose/N-acetylgalactosamine-transporter subunit IIB [Lactobacillus gasseri]|jgi:PTS system mannose-specific IIB component|uniref:PTS system mannose/fructose/N-acetylgalactosamine-transporter subunit IIB n=1 Tax=Lactobacillus gasseri TaxID=1596 RepID=UPI00166C14CE|nr:PTS sugar transporter subunit IIB [Lactobacillus gasseri]MBD0889732.1 PTS transporter subunit IIB [Lactobacillus gasseri]